MKHLLSLRGITSSELMELFELAQEMKSHPAKYASSLRRKTVALLFQKPSTRTRVAFEAGVFEMGGNSLYLAPEDIQLGRGETVGDTTRVLSRLVQILVARVYAQEDLEEMAASSTIPIINGLSDRFHPCQAIADYFTLLEKKKKLEGLKLAYVGDGNNVAHSLIQGGAKLGVHVAIACPKGYEPEAEVINSAREDGKASGARIEVLDQAAEAVRDADAVYTDVWTSMGQETEEQRRRILFKDYQVTEDLFAQARTGACFMHCLPAHRGDEVSSEVMDSEASVVFEQAENRLHTQKAIIFQLLKEVC